MKSRVVICGAGISGISAAYFLAVRNGWQDVLLVDERPPLSLTSDKSTECYRNWWPGPGDAMVSFMNHSIDLLEGLAQSSENVFRMNRRGYLYVTGDPVKIPGLLHDSQDIANSGAGTLRVYTHLSQASQYHPHQSDGFIGEPEGADLFLDQQLIHQYFPYLTEQAVATLHVRRAGWFSAQQLGTYLLDQARNCGVTLAQACISGVETHSGRIQAVRLEDGGRIETECLINAAGPFANQVSSMMGLELPIYHEVHLKASFRDHLGVLPRNAPLVIWTDNQVLPWQSEERELLAEEETLQFLLRELPGGAHTRPEGEHGSPMILMLWDYHTVVHEPTWPPPLDEMYPELALRGLTTMIPGFRAYIGHAARPYLDGGYYTRTRENRPLIGSLPVEGAYLIGALSGYGLMGACAAGELLAQHVTGQHLPTYAPYFSLSRYQDPDYQHLLENWGDTGQL